MQNLRDDHVKNTGYQQLELAGAHSEASAQAACACTLPSFNNHGSPVNSPSAKKRKMLIRVNPLIHSICGE
jgi:hypothetical protein